MPKYNIKWSAKDGSDSFEYNTNNTDLTKGCQEAILASIENAGLKNKLNGDAPKEGKWTPEWYTHRTGLIVESVDPITTKIIGVSN
ncbi:TPA: hypothetical protein PXP39_001911 [Yersinia enterocolitica]|nr:hypothetical protein [Yersinia enterocolitica]HDL7832050.1 hypothetical protein [Yersinia enterocolitica]HDL7872714.1 hypothetical protein [Yersinia enterocolitica]HDL7885557.1 hypothetical protein [Yersinia enterocolitica]HDL7894023.1 hypothetical protein [Yersinia enterocolitica]